MIDRTMTRRSLSSSFAALLLSSCGYVGIELRDVGADGGERADARVGEPDASVLDDGGEGLDGRVSEADGALVDGALDDVGLGDGALADGSLPDAAQADAGSDAGNACDLTGSWAVKVSVPLNWASPILEPSTDQAYVWMRYQGTQTGLSWSGDAQPCGFLLPDFRLNPLVAAESYAVRVPDVLFDRQPPYLAPVAASFSLTGASRVGDSLSLSQLALVIGTDLANPLTDPWPVDRNALTPRDTDLDARPGITIDYLSDATHVYPPLDFTRTLRASKSYLAVRLTFQGSGTIDSCTQLTGPIAFSHFDTHILGCQLAGSSTQCDAALTDFLDLNRPSYTPNAANYQAIKVPANTTCAQIRALLPP
jgi:hypothetical protein